MKEKERSEQEEIIKNLTKLIIVSSKVASEDEEFKAKVRVKVTLSGLWGRVWEGEYTKVIIVSRKVASEDEEFKAKVRDKVTLSGSWGRVWEGEYTKVIIVSRKVASEDEEFQGQGKGQGHEGECGREKVASEDEEFKAKVRVKVTLPWSWGRISPTDIYHHWLQW